MSRPSPNRDMRSPIDEECLHEDTRCAATQAELDANLALFRAGKLAPEYTAYMARRAAQ